MSYPEKNADRKTHFAQCEDPKKHEARDLRRLLGGAFGERAVMGISKETQALCYVGTSGGVE